MSNVIFRNVNKIYDNKVQAVFDFNLEVADKEFIVLVGPSGCGKSTTLRMLAGLEEITNGEISIDGRIINDVHPKNRDIAMVFQNYALYPHMTVYDNMAFALKMRTIPEETTNEKGETKVTYRHLTKDEIKEKVLHAAKILALEEYLDRKPKALSGGQRQRVALGRAIVRTPKVFLMDEPLSNLDAKLRVQMRSEIIKIHKNVGATTIYVTHDQTEAMTMADRIVIMKDGYVQQIGTPKEVYNYPNNTFVGGFIGSPAMNFFTCFVKGNEFSFLGQDGAENISYPLDKKHKEILEKYRLAKISDIDEMVANIDAAVAELQSELESDSKQNNKVVDAMNAHMDKLIELKNNYLEEKVGFENGEYKVILGIRPEDITVASKKSKKVLPLKVDLSELLGHELIIYSYIAGQRVIIKVPAKNELEDDESFNAELVEDKIHFFDCDTTNRIIF